MKRAFTLVELLVCMAIVAMLLGLLAPAILASRSAARAAHCQSNLHQIGVDLANFEAKFGYVQSYWRVADPRIQFCPEPMKYFGVDTLVRYSVPPVFDNRRRLKRCQLTRDTPSHLVGVAHDCWDAHRGERFVLFLDGHVDISN